MKFSITCIFSILLLLLSCCLFSQNHFKTSESIKDESGGIRLFKIENVIPHKIEQYNPKDLLKSALNTNIKTDFKLIKTSKEKIDCEDLLFQQLYEKLPVYDAYYYLHFKKGSLDYANGEFSEIQSIKNNIKINGKEAVEIACYNEKMLNNEADVEKIIWRKSKSQLYNYVYLVEISSHSKQYFIDAEDGAILSIANTACFSNVPCSGAGYYNGNYPFTGDKFSSGLNTRLRENRNGVSITTLNAQYDWETNNAIDFTDNDTYWNFSEHVADRQAIDVHFGSEKYIDYFKQFFGRNSIDNNNFPITSYIHVYQGIPLLVPAPMDNAYWSKTTKTFRYGDGKTNFKPMVALDVVAHEMAHGMAYFAVGFNSLGEPDVLNEGFSDIWGSVIENWVFPSKPTWLQGSEVMKNGFSCIRSSSSPKTQGFQDGNLNEGNCPDTRLGTFWDVNNVDTHVNSTVLSHWFYLLSVGGVGTNDLGNNFNVSPLGIQVSAQIAYNAEINLTPSADLMSVRAASINYAISTFGYCSNEVTQIAAAWYAVGVGDNLTIYAPISSTTLSSLYHPIHTNGNVRFSVYWEPAITVPTEIKWYNAATNQLLATTSGYVNNFEWAPNCPSKPKTNNTDCISVYAVVVACNTVQSNIVGGIFNCFYKTWSTQWGGCPLYQRNVPIENEPIVTDGLKVYPNPATTSFTISHTSIINKIRIIDKTGRINKQQVFSNQLRTQTISTIGLKPDVYTVIVSDSEKEYTTKLVVL